MNLSIPLGKAICETLHEQGARVVFGIPGVHNQEIYRGLQESGLKHILARHEQGAAFMADGYARATGRPGVVFVITGPGLTNALTAVGQSYSDSVPILVIASCLNQSEDGPGTAYLHKLKNQTAAGDSVADWSVTESDPELAIKRIHQAFSEFKSMRPRPKILNLPTDSLQLSTVRRRQNSSEPNHKIPADREAAGELARQMERSQRTLFIFGGGAVKAAAQARQVLAQAGAASFLTYAGRGVIPSSCGLNFGSYLARPGSKEIINSAHLVVAIGTELSEVDLWRRELGSRDAVLRIDIDTEVLDQSGSFCRPVYSDARAFLTHLSEELDGRPLFSHWNETEIAKTRREFRAACDAERPGIASVAETLCASLPENSIVYSDMTQFSYVAKEVVPAEQPGRWHHPYGFGTLGYALPAAIGGKIACPDSAVVAIAGDYGFQYTLQELGTASELQLALPIVIWDNQSLGEIADSMIKAQIKPTAVKAFNPDFSALGAAYGLHTAEPRTVEDLCDAVRAAFQADRPTLIRADAAVLIADHGRFESQVTL